MSMLKSTIFFILSIYLSITQVYAHPHPTEDAISCLGSNFLADKCRATCASIYKTQSDKERCYRLDVATVKRIKYIHKLLHTPYADWMEMMDSRDFNTYLQISNKAFLNVIRKSYTIKEAREILLFVVENEDIAEQLEKNDADHLILKELLEKAEPYGDLDENMWKYFAMKLPRFYTQFNRLLELVVESSNESAHNYFLDYINNNQADCLQGTETTACFKQYCKIGQIMDDNISEDWLGFEEFDEYIESIIDERVNGSSTASDKCWDIYNIENVGDVDNWVNDLCKQLTSDSGTACAD